MLMPFALLAVATPADASTGGWTGTWASALTTTGGAFAGLDNQSVRMIAQASVGGSRLRVRLSNVGGDRPLVVGKSTVARPAIPSEPDLDPATLAPLTFRGLRTVTIPVGKTVLSDPVRLAVPAFGQLAVTLYLPQPTGEPSFHFIGKQRTFIYAGDRAADPSGAGAAEVNDHFYFLAGIEVDSPNATGAVAVIGDSIADGFGATQDANTRWPDYLARRITPSGRGVVNIALAGNAVAHDGSEVGLPFVGRRAIGRLADDLYPHARVRTVIVGLGLADIFTYEESPQVITGALRELSAELHRRGYRVLFATLTPGAGAENWDPSREATRQAVNHYIRTGRDSDGVVDADAAVRDPADPNRLDPAYFSFDQVHPNDAGNRAIAAAVPVHLL